MDDRLEEKNGYMSFWEHLDVLRGSLVKIAGVTLLCAVALFFFKQQLFDVVLAPQDSRFVTYRLFSRLSGLAGSEGQPPFSVQLINTELASQFLIHVKMSLYVGVMAASPYILYLLFRFVSPALYRRERRCSVQVVTAGYLMFLCGLLFNYFVIFPFTFRFLGTYQVSEQVENIITLQSYIDTLTMLSLWMGVLFELPVISWLLGRAGLLSASLMRRVRKQAIVAILVAAAIITPTSDAFTLFLVSAPVYLLYEASIFIVQCCGSPKRETA